ncbi:unnamed protein product [Cyprideis torosa]|uniref:Uncharacterized protein n=1 Tax=Cyprideis torosa TaxID=163714 RepID=A0A7R8ZR27_9CRUS|nr:unnamed protein product [Cyprideis torosa]CAG0902704.1 unnamed protein product [Cyprideis torosa]
MADPIRWRTGATIRLAPSSPSYSSGASQVIPESARAFRVEPKIVTIPIFQESDSSDSTPSHAPSSGGYHSGGGSPLKLRFPSTKRDDSFNRDQGYSSDFSSPVQSREGFSTPKSSGTPTYNVSPSRWTVESTAPSPQVAQVTSPQHATRWGLDAAPFPKVAQVSSPASRWTNDNQSPSITSTSSNKWGSNAGNSSPPTSRWASDSSPIVPQMVEPSSPSSRWGSNNSPPSPQKSFQQSPVSSGQYRSGSPVSSPAAPQSPVRNRTAPFPTSQPPAPPPAPPTSSRGGMPLAEILKGSLPPPKPPIDGPATPPATSSAQSPLATPATNGSLAPPPPPPPPPGSAGGGGGGPPPPPPPPPPGSAGKIAPTKLPTEIQTEIPGVIQVAMATKDKKPFSYTPSGIDLAAIRSQRMRQRVQRNLQENEMLNATSPKPDDGDTQCLPSQVGSPRPVSNAQPYMAALCTPIIQTSSVTPSNACVSESPTSRKSYDCETRPWANSNKSPATPSEENFSSEDIDPRYRGAHIPSRAFRMLQGLTGETNDGQRHLDL